MKRIRTAIARWIEPGLRRDIMHLRTDLKTTRAQFNELRRAYHTIDTISRIQSRRADTAEARVHELERELASANTTVDGLGLENARLETALERGDLLNRDRRHALQMDHEGDDLCPPS